MHLPEVKGSDDAKQAMWVPLIDLDPCRDAYLKTGRKHRFVCAKCYCF